MVYKVWRKAAIIYTLEKKVGGLMARSNYTHYREKERLKI